MLTRPRGRKGETLKEQTRSVDAFTRDSLIGKAVARVVQNTPFATGVYDALVAMFPTGDLPAAQGSGRPVPRPMGNWSLALVSSWPSGLPVPQQARMDSGSSIGGLSRRTRIAGKMLRK